MAIQVGENGLASDFITTSAGASDEGRVPKLNDEGQLDRSFIKTSFGGNGSDGALTISSGTTNIDLGGAQVVVRNYTSISITGTGALTFSNPHVNGTIIKLKCQGNVTITSSASPAINVTGMGGEGGTTVQGTNFFLVSGSGTGYFCTGALPVGVWNTSVNGQNGANLNQVSNSAYINTTSSVVVTTSIPLGVLPQVSQESEIYPGGGGSGGSRGAVGGTLSNGGRGGGALDIECRGALNFTGSIWAKGVDSASADTRGGHGAGGTVRVLYGSLTANTGTIDVTSTGNIGQSLVAPNQYKV